METIAKYMYKRYIYLCVCVLKKKWHERPRKEAVVATTKPEEYKI